MSLEQVPEKPLSGTGLEVDDQKMDPSDASDSHVETVGEIPITRKQTLRKIDTYLLPMVRLSL